MPKKEAFGKFAGLIGGLAKKTEWGLWECGGEGGGVDTQMHTLYLRSAQWTTTISAIAGTKSTDDTWTAAATSIPEASATNQHTQNLQLLQQ